MTADCICAPATAAGGAISIVRISGAGCLGIVDSVVVFRHGDAASASGFSVKFGVIPELDEVLVSVFKSPHSYTGEDMAEISCHASQYIVSGILERLCAAGCRLALAGEFTQRAFVAGKMDLSQAEAIADLIASDSAASHKLAFSQLRGAYSQKLHELKRQMTELAALLELELDFSEEEVEFADRSRLKSMVQETLLEIQKLAESFKLGNAFKKGIPVAIVGAVNSGKSTLLNALLGEDRAIVSDIPGTTRDTVEEVISINGIKYRFIDTAGLRETADTVEQMGIERSLNQIDKASVVIVLLDGTVPVESLAPVTEGVMARLRPETRVIWVRSKADLCPRPAEGWPQAIELSALTGQCLDVLKYAISRPDSDALASDSVLVTNQRHYDALRRAAEDLKHVQDGLGNGAPTDLIAEDLRSGTSALGEIFGEILPDDILGAVFSRFCIGK